MRLLDGGDGQLLHPRPQDKPVPGSEAGTDIELPFAGVRTGTGSLTVTQYGFFEPRFDIVSFDWKSGAQRQPSLTSDAEEYGPVWRADGEIFAFVGDNDRQTDIYVADQSASKVTRVTETDRVSETPLSWSPDGSRLLFSARKASDPLADVDLFTLDLANGTRTRLTRSGGIGKGASWSLDGKWIAYVSKDETYGYDIHLMDVNGKHHRRLTSDKKDEDSPDFSPDGRQLLFAKAGGASTDTNEIWVMDLATQQARRLVKAGPFQKVRTPVWSPDGSWIAFCRDSDDRAESVYVMRPGTPNRTRLVYSGESLSIAVDWQPV